MSDATQMMAVRRFARARAAFRCEHVPIPVPNPGQALVRLLQGGACGGCGSDLHVFENHHGYEWVAEKVTVGHEFAGILESPGVPGINPGSAVTAMVFHGCQQCDYCKSGDWQLCYERKVQGLSFDGGMAEFVVVEIDHLLPANGLPLHLAALTEPTSIGVHAISRLGRKIVDADVVVSGPGIIGMINAIIARAAGAASVTVAGAEQDLPLRLPMAEKLGFRTLIVGKDKPSIREQLGERIDVVIEASGSPFAIPGAVDAVHRGGTVVLVGIYSRPVPEFAALDLVRNEIDLTPSYGSSRPDYELAIETIRANQSTFEALIEIVDPKDVVSVFERMSAAQIMKPVFMF